MGQTFFRNYLCFQGIEVNSNLSPQNRWFGHICYLLCIYIFWICLGTTFPCSLLQILKWGSCRSGADYWLSGFTGTSETTAQFVWEHSLAKKIYRLYNYICNVVSVISVWVIPLVWVEFLSPTLINSCLLFCQYLQRVIFKPEIDIPFFNYFSY